MDVSEIPGLRVESAGNDVTYILPARPLGLMRVAAIAPILFSAIWLGVLWTFFFPNFLRNSGNRPHGAPVPLLVFAIFFAVVGCFPAMTGFATLWGRFRIRWRDRRLFVAQMLGPLAWPRSLPKQPIHRFVVAGGGEPGSPLPQVSGMLVVHYENGQTANLALGYPRPWLEALAQDLSGRIGFTSAATAPKVEISQGGAAGLTEDALEKPPGSRITLERREASILLDVPPAGLWKGSGGMMFFACFWLGILSVITVGGLLSAHFQWEMGLFLSLFWLVGFLFGGAAIRMGRQRVTFTAGPSGLTVVRSSPFGTKRIELRREDLAEVAVHFSGMEVNNRPVPELQIIPQAGRKIGFLVGRNPEELRWVATELRKALNLQAPPAGSAAPDSWLNPITRRQMQRASPASSFIGLFIFLAVALVMFWRPLSLLVKHTNKQVTTAPGQPGGLVGALSNLPVPGEPDLVFNAFGPGKSYGTNAWNIHRQAHAEWFVPTASGPLSEIELALAPAGKMKPGTADVFLAADQNGSPGEILEAFTVHADDVGETVRLDSVRSPSLTAGRKYWVGARGRQPWLWYSNNQRVIHDCRREVSRGQWVSAGSYGFVGAFRVRILPQPVPPSTNFTVVTNAP
jgi:hypothetical protein